MCVLAGHALRLLCVCALLLQAGCMAAMQQRASMNTHLATGNFAAAAQLAEQQDSNESDVLASLNKGMLRRMVSDYKGSNAIFEKAKRRIDDLYGVSVSDQLAAFTINDTLRDYSGDRYEQVLLHAFMALNYIELGLPESARVEMLQADVKMREWGEQPEEDPFVRYLSGIIYEMMGEYDEAVVSYRKAVHVYRDTRHKHNTAVPKQLKTDLLNLLYRQNRRSEYDQLKREFSMQNFEPLPRDASHVVVVLNHGTAPARSEHAIQTFATELQNVVRIALPRYARPANRLNKPVLSIAGNEKGFETVENVDALARAALEDDMGSITARAIARAVVKHQTSTRAAEKGGELAGFFATVTNLVTERADTRSWTTLPQQIQLARLTVAPGQHDVVMKMKNSAGYTIDRVKRRVNVPRGGLALTSIHWVAPLPQNRAIQASTTSR